MKTDRFFFMQGVLLFSGVLFCAAPSFALGLASPLGWQGNGSRILGRQALFTPFGVVQEDISDTVNSATSTSFSQQSPGMISASAATGDYRASGAVSAQGYWTPWRSGGYFRDELYFESSNKQAAQIEFSFNVDAEAKLLGSGWSKGSAELYMIWGAYQDKDDFSLLSYKPILSINGRGDTAAYKGTVTMGMLDLDSNNLLESGTYLPYSLGIWGDAVDARLGWENISLADVMVKDADGNILDNDEYTLKSTNDSLAFGSFENPPSAVPLPSSFLLLGSAFVGVLGLRRKRLAA